MQRTVSTFGVFALLFVFLCANQPSASAATRKYYLTRTSTIGSGALTACATGFHMASLGEIFNTTALKYNRSKGQTADDSGFGPPQECGWIRTGFPANSMSGVPGRSNCSAWSTGNGGDLGTFACPYDAVSLPWNSASQSTSPWFTGVGSCGSPLRVWCIED